MPPLSREVVDGSELQRCKGGNTENVPKGRGSPPPDAASHLLQLFSDDRCIATGCIKFFLCLRQVLLRVVVRMDELMNESGGLFAHGAVGVCGNIGWQWKIRRYLTWARTTTPNGGMSRS